MQSLFTRIAWARVQQYVARYKSVRIAVAGSFGRTLVSDMIYSALREHRHVRNGYPVQDESDIPLGMLGAPHEKQHHNMISFLMGVKHKELIEREPDTLITELPILVPGFAPQAVQKILPRFFVLHRVVFEHLDLFEHENNLFHEYEQVLAGLAPDAVILVNADDKHVGALTQSQEQKKVTYGRTQGADVYLAKAVRGEAGKGIYVEIVVKRKHYEAFMPNLFAKEHVTALLSAVACAHALHVDIKSAIHAMKHTPIPHGALQKVEAKNGAVLLTEHVECADQAVESLKTLGSLPGTGRKIAVIGDIEHLGAETIAEHERIAVQAGLISPLIIFVGPAMRSARQVVDVQGKSIDTHHFENAEEAGNWIAKHIRANDMLYIAGGVSVNMESIVERLISQ